MQFTQFSKKKYRFGYSNISEIGREYVGDRFVNVSIHEAIETVNRAINNTLREIMDPNRRRTPSDLLTLFRYTSRSRITVHTIV